VKRLKCGCHPLNAGDLAAVYLMPFLPKYEVVVYFGEKYYVVVNMAFTANYDFLLPIRIAALLPYANLW